MTKKLFLAVLLAALVVVFTTDNSAYAQSSPTLKVTVAKPVKPGGTGTLTIKFKHGTKVKIPQEPAIEITLRGEGITATGSPTFTVDEDGYIKSSSIKYKFNLSSNATSGSTISLSGSVKFGYCSTETGTCKIGNQSFTVNVKVK